MLDSISNIIGSGWGGVAAGIVGLIIAWIIGKKIHNMKVEKAERETQEQRGQDGKEGRNQQEHEDKHDEEAQGKRDDFINRETNDG
jgi:Na+/glutamate symporter